MFITRECDYAVRVVRALDGENRLSVNEICEKEEITAPFAYKILKKLQKAGLVKGFRGVHGGYSMNKSASEITLLDIYMAIDPHMFIVECLNPTKPCPRHGANGRPCKVHQELADIQQELWRHLSSKTMADILGDGEK